MTVTAVDGTATIRFGGGDAWVTALYDQLSGGGYDRCSVLPIPVLIDEWRAGHRTARKRADRAYRRGYRFAEVLRHERADEILAINTSMPERQGRRMSDGYWQRPSETPLPDYPDPRYAIRTYGVETATGTLVSYLWLYRAGDLALVSSILGHADHLEEGVMYLLFQGALEVEMSVGPGWVVYNRADSGQDGLIWFKDRLGFKARLVEWCR